MKIGVDAGALAVSDNRLKLGVYWVNVNLLRELTKIDKKNTYLLYSFAPIDREVMASFGPGMSNKVLKPKKAWFSLRLPLELRLHPVDIFLGLSQAIPRSASHNIGFIYDLGFLHYPEAYPGSQKKLTKLTTDLIRRSYHIVTISNIVKDDVIKRYGVNVAKITVAYPGVDETFTPVGPKHKEKNPYFLFVGALKRGKNIPFALRVFKKFLEKTKKQYNFVLVGGNYWEDPKIKETIKGLGITNRVKLAGFVSDEDLRSYYRGAEALLITSLWEGFCLPAAEAMSCGCPVVYPNTGSLPEIVGSAGTQFDAGNEESAVSALLNKKSGGAGTMRARQFNWSRFAKEVYRIIHSHE